MTSLELSLIITTINLVVFLVSSHMNNVLVQSLPGYLLALPALLKSFMIKMWQHFCDCHRQFPCQNRQSRQSPFRVFGLG